MEKSVKNYSGRERVVPALLLVIGLVCASWMSTQNKNENAIGPDQAILAQDTVKKAKKKTSKAEKKETEISSTKKDNKGNSSDSSLLDSEEFSNDYAWHFYQGPPPFPPGPPAPVLPDLPIPFAFDDYQFSLGDGNNWEEFNKQFEENFKSKFGDFYLKHEKDIQQMMEDAQAKVHGKFDEEWQMKMEGFARQQEEWAKNFAQNWERQEELMAEQQDAFRKSAEEMGRRGIVPLNPHPQRRHSEEFEKNHRMFEQDMGTSEDELKSEWIKDGYLGKDEKLKSIRWENDLIEINGKQVKPEDVKKYNERFSARNRLKEFEKSQHEFEKKRKAFEDKNNLDELKAELIKDGYFGEDEIIESIRRVNDSIEINGKKIKPEHEKKYKDILNGC